MHPRKAVLALKLQTMDGRVAYFEVYITVLRLQSSCLGQSEKQDVAWDCNEGGKWTP
jgi:hypothetical protein